MQEVSRSYDQADENARQVVRRTRNVTRRKYTPEEKVRIVIEGIHGEISVSALCRREGINTGVYYVLSPVIRLQPPSPLCYILRLVVVSSSGKFRALQFWHSAKTAEQRNRRTDSSAN